MQRQTLSFILSFALLLTSFAGMSPVGARTAYAQTARTHVSDTIIDGAGHPLSGKVTFILTKQADSPGGLIPVGASVTAVLDAAGRFDVYLYPSSSLSPATYYQVYTTTGAGNQTLLGVYSIPAATTVVTLAPNRVTNTALAAQYTFASQTSVQTLSQNVAAATLASLLPVPPTNNALQKYSAATGTFGNSSVTDDGTTVSIGGAAVLKSSDKNTANGVAGLDSQSKVAASALPTIDITTTTGILGGNRIAPTLSDKTLVNATLNTGSDATGDMFYRGADGKLARLGIGTTGQVLTATPGAPAWAENGSNGSSSSGTATTLSQGLVAYYNLNELSGARNDSVGTNHLAPSGTVGYASGKISQSASFNDTLTPTLSVADNTSLSIQNNSNFWVSFWYKRGTQRAFANPGLVAKWAGTQNEYLIYFSRDIGQVKFAVQGGGVTTEVVATDTALSDNSWYQINAWYDSVAQKIYLQVNTETTQGTVYNASHTAGVADSDAPFTIGAIGANSYLSGLVDELGVWKGRIPSAADRAAIWNNGAGVSYPFAGAAISTVSKQYTYHIKDDFNASGSNQATTGSIQGGSNILTVPSTIDFKAGQGILIAGAGAIGADLVTTINAITGTTLALANNASVTVTAALVQHDDTKALQDDLDATFLKKGAKTFFPAGDYYLNRAINPACNAVICYPYNNNSQSPYTARWEGEFVTRTSENPLTASGVRVLCTRVQGTGIFPAVMSAAPYTDTDNGGYLNYVVPEIENFYFVTAPNPSLSGLNFSNSSHLFLHHVNVVPSSYYGVVEPTNTQSTAILTPQINNHAFISLEYVSVYGFYNGIQASEHITFDGYCFVSRCKVALRLKHGGRPVSGKIGLEDCARFVVVDGDCTVKLLLNIQRSSGTEWYNTAANEDIYDPLDVLHGSLEINLTQSNTSGAHAAITKTGATHVEIFDLYTGARTRN